MAPPGGVHPHTTLENLPCAPKPRREDPSPSYPRRAGEGEVNYCVLETGSTSPPQQSLTQEATRMQPRG